MKRESTFDRPPGPTHKDLLGHRRNYSPEGARRFLQNYRSVARGFAEALFIRGLVWRCTYWLCPGCERLHREPCDEVREFQCRPCGWIGDKDELLLGKR